VGLEYTLMHLAYSEEAPIRDKPSLAPIILAPNDLPEPDIANAERHDMVLGGGMMGGMSGAMMNGQMTDMRTMMQGGVAWAINGVAAREDQHAMPPMLNLDRGSSCILNIRNETAWYHPMHLHGHSFRVISRNGAPAQFREWRDTVLVVPKERVEIAFVADNPGDWMIHCHVLAHQAGGMMGVIHVA
jgi:FtsP/CotA-like multicopper oxidase with cupredoxin domain